MAVEIFVELMNEGTKVWRPVQAEHLRDNVYKILPQEIPEDEQWKFSPGSRVVCERKPFDDASVKLIAQYQDFSNF
jgi:hypothetical protein